MEEPVITTPFTINFNVFGNFTMSPDAINKINKIVIKDQQKQQKDQIKKNKIINKIARQYKLLNPPKIIIEI